MKLRMRDDSKAFRTSGKISYQSLSVRKLLPLLATFAVILAAVGESSCSGYTTAASVSGTGGGGGATAGNPGAGVLSANSTSLSFGNVAVGSTGSQSVTVTNTGTATVNIASATITGAAFTVVGGNPAASIPVGQSATVQIQLAPIAAGAATGTFTVTSDASNSPLAVSLSGTGTQPVLAMAPASLNFNNIPVGQTSTQTVTLTNSGNASLILNLATVSGTGFAMSSLSLPKTITAGQNLSLSVQFTPTSTTGASGSIVFTDNASGSTQTLTMTGSAVATGSTLGANPGSFNFNSVVAGSTSPQSITLTNSGNATVTINQVTTTGSSFSTSGLAANQTIAAGASMSFTAQFAPTTSGTVSGNVAITSTATNATLNIPLSGTGTQGALSANPPGINFAGLAVGASGSVSVTLSNTGTSSVSITAHSITGTGFTLTGWAAPASLTPGQTTSFTVTFAPTAIGAANGSVSISNGAPGSPLTIALTGTGQQAQISASPTSVAFTNVVVGNSNSQPITLRNNGNGTLSFPSVAVAGTGMTLTGLSTSTTIAAGGSLIFNAVYTPSSTTAVNGSITLTTNGTPSSLVINLSGTGLAATRILGANPTSLSFGTVNVNSSSPLTSILTNSGNSNLTISGMAVAGAGFTASGVANGTILTPGQTATLTVIFSPTTGGAVNGAKVSVTSNATGSPMAIPLTGTGQASSSSSVLLQWDASPTAGISGYNIFRATTSGGYGSSPLNPSPVSALTYSDTTATSGVKYFYVVTAVNSAGNSADSNEASATP